jgi:hypothetical protein
VSSDVRSGVSADVRTDEGADEITMEKCGVKRETGAKPVIERFRDL